MKKLKTLAMGAIMAILFTGCSTYNAGIRAALKIPNEETNRLNLVGRIVDAKSRADAAQVAVWCDWCRSWSCRGHDNWRGGGGAVGTYIHIP